MIRIHALGMGLLSAALMACCATRDGLNISTLTSCLIQSLQSLAISPALFRPSTRPALRAGARWLSAPSVAPNAPRLALSGTINWTVHPLPRRVCNSPLRGLTEFHAIASVGPMVGASTRAVLQPLARSTFVTERTPPSMYPAKTVLKLIFLRPKQIRPQLVTTTTLSWNG